MLCEFKNREDLENLEGLASLKNQVEQFQLHDKVGEQSFCQNFKKKYMNQFLIQLKMPLKI